jgi:hypothetical protein
MVGNIMIEEQTTIHPFLRQVEVIVGPLSEKQGGGAEKDGIRFFGDGSTDNLRIRFDINKPAMGSSVSIYNLGRKIRNSLHSAPGLKMIVRAGWRNYGMVTIWSGSLTASYSSRQGTDLVTELIGYAAWYSTMETVISRTLTQGQSIRQAVIELAHLLEGVTVNEQLVDIDDVQIGEQALSFAHTAKIILDSLSRLYGFTWWVDEGIFYAIQDSRAFTTSTTPLISAKSGYLLRAEPMIASPMPLVMGVSISSLFFPYVLPYRKVQVESVVNPEINREYVAHTISHHGDTHSDQWETIIQSWRYDKKKKTPPLTAAQFTEIELIAGTIFGEASGEPREGKLAVGMTIQTRKEHPRIYASSWSEVVLGDRQFACWSDQQERIVADRNSNTSSWQECMDIAQSISQGKKFDVGLTNSPTNFVSGDPVYWEKSMNYIGTIKNHRFYHDPRVG